MEGLELFAFNPCYSDEFDPYFVWAKDLADAEAQLRHFRPIGIYNVYKLAPMKPQCFIVNKPMEGKNVYTLECIKTLR